MIKRLTSLQNETVKKAASLQQKKYRLREGLFLVEGVRAVREVRSSSWTVTNTLGGSTGNVGRPSSSIRRETRRSARDASSSVSSSRPRVSCG